MKAETQNRRTAEPQKPFWLSAFGCPLSVVSESREPLAYSRFCFLLSVFCILFCASMAEAQPRQAQLPWWDRAPERWIGSYWIKSDLPAEQVNAIGRHLNFMHGEYSKRTGHVPLRAEDKLHVLVFADRDEWAMNVKTRYAVTPPAPNDAMAFGGYFIAPTDQVLAIHVANISPRHLEQLIQREAFRQFAYNRFGDDLPRWLSEGMADLFGDAVVLGDKLLFGQSTPEQLDEVSAAIDSGEFIPLDIMQNITAQEWNTAMKEFSPTLPHRQARLMALYLLQVGQSQPSQRGSRASRAGSMTAIDRYMRHLNNGMLDQDAFARVFGANRAAFESDWKAFVKQQKPGSLITAMDRIDFLAAGMLELHQRKVYPQTIDQLKASLREIDFKWKKLTLHGEVELSASNDALFVIPKDELCSNQPAFVVSKPRAPSSRKEQALEKDSPTPATLATENLRPIGVQVRWVRDAVKNTFTYQIVLR